MRKLFDKVTVLYEGRQIFFGQISEAHAYFEELGFECNIPQSHGGLTSYSACLFLT